MTKPLQLCLSVPRYGLAASNEEDVGLLDSDLGLPYCLTVEEARQLGAEIGAGSIAGVI